jgi:hypothetical protein
MGWPLTYFVLACVIVVCFNGFLSFVAFDDFHCGLLLAHTFFVVFGGAVGSYVWSGVGGGVLRVRGGDRHGLSWIGDGHGGVCSGCISRNIKPGAVCGWWAVVDAETTIDGSTTIEVLLHWTLLAIVFYRVSVVSSGGTSSFIFSRSHATCPTWPQHRLMHRSAHRQAGPDVDTLVLSWPPFDSFIRPLQQGCLLSAEPSYLSYPAPMKTVVSHGPLRIQMLLPKPPPMVVHPLAHDQLVL